MQPESFLFFTALTTVARIFCNTFRCRNVGGGVLIHNSAAILDQPNVVPTTSPLRVVVGCIFLVIDFFWIDLQCGFTTFFCCGLLP